jgi:CubicO group peptidase (beta-lactamase class C family)
MQSSRLSLIPALIDQAISDRKMPGCVICVGRHGKIIYLQAFGNKQTEPSPLPMTIDTVFDMASITKPVATATSIMALIEDGKIRLASRVADFMPEFAPNGKDAITIENLLVHQSGLIPDNPIADYSEGPDKAWQKICDLKLAGTVGNTFTYSDVNFIVLGELVKRVSGQTLHEFSQARIFAPLGMNETGFLPSQELKARAAPTERRNNEWMRGEVHDPRAHALGGIAGHAGLFSTAKDMANYSQMMLNRGNLALHDQTKATRVLSSQTVQLMTSDRIVSSGIRGLGWDKRTGYSSNRGDLLSDEAFGHGGFTGTVLWIDPKLDLFFIFLSNRVHPNGQGSVNQLAGQILNIVASSIVDEDK